MKSDSIKIMPPCYPLRNLSKPSTARGSQSTKRSTPSTSGHGSNKRRSRLLPHSAPSSRGTDDRTPAGTPAPIQPLIRTNVERDGGAHQDDFDDNLDHVVLAIDKSRKKTIGCSYYVAEHGVLYVMEDIESADEDTVQSCKMQPSFI